MTTQAHAIYEKSEHARWFVGAHRGCVSCIHVRTVSTIDGRHYPRLFTAGSDGIIRIWNGLSGMAISQTSGISSAIMCMEVIKDSIYIGNDVGELICLDLSGRPKIKWQAHRRSVNCLQVVNEGRVFTGSQDCTVKLFSPDGEVLRQFPANPDDCTEPIVSLRAVPGNLLFVGTARGTLYCYNMRQELIKTLRTSSLQGRSLKHMNVLCSRDKISIFIGSGKSLITWYITRVNDRFDDTKIRIDAVKAIEGRVPLGEISCIRAIYANPLRTRHPTVYLGTTSGRIYLYIPTTKFERGNSRTHYIEAQKFKFYTFKDATTPILTLGTGCGRVFAGTKQGNVLMWKEPYNMLKLRAILVNQDDGHSYRGNMESRGSRISQYTADSNEEPESRAQIRVDNPQLLDKKNFDDSYRVPDDSSEMNLIEIPLESGRRNSNSASNSQRGSEDLSSSQNVRSQTNSAQQRSQSPSVLPFPSSSAESQRSGSFSQYETPNSELDITALLTASIADLQLLPEPNLNEPPLPFTPQIQSPLFAQQLSFMGSQPLGSNNQQFSTLPPNFYQSNPLPGQQSFQQFSQQPPQTNIPDERDLYNKEKDALCVICLDQKKNAALYGCGHACVCFECGKELVQRKQNCPLCRAPIRDCMKLFL